MLILATDRGKLDLLISNNLVDQSSQFGILIENFGELPAWIVILLATLLPLIKKIKLKKYMVILSILVFIVSMIAISLIMPTLWTIITITLIISIALLINKYLNIPNNAIIIFNRISVIMLIFVPGIIVNAMKLIWGRYRFRNLDDSQQLYTPWYQINGITGEKSFPSGHSAMGIMVFPLIILIKSLNLNKKIEIFIELILIIWAILVAWGRVIIGAHYASDVIFSLFLGLMAINYLTSNQKFFSK